jgi:putative ABC transport system substrate-binding protein
MSAPCAPARAQQALPIVGFISAVGRTDRHIEAFHQGLIEHGRQPGRHVRIEERYADGDLERLRRQIAELIGLGTRVFVTAGDNAMLLIQAQAPQAAVVVAAAGNYGNLTLGGSISRPGGNVTGFALLSADLSAKRLQLLRDIMPALRRVSVLVNPTAPSAPPVEAYRSGAASLGIEVRVLEVTAGLDLTAAFATERAAGSDAIVAYRNYLFESRHDEIIRALAVSGLASAFEERFYVRAGALMAYSVLLPDLFRRAAGKVVKILDGARPADLPVELPTRFDLTVNARTAKALSLTIPPAILIAADEVIE